MYPSESLTHSRLSINDRTHNVILYSTEHKMLDKIYMSMGYLGVVYKEMAFQLNSSLKHLKN